GREASRGVRYRRGNVQPRAAPVRRLNVAGKQFDGELGGAQPVGGAPTGHDAQRLSSALHPGRRAAGRTCLPVIRRFPRHRAGCHWPATSPSAAGPASRSPPTAASKALSPASSPLSCLAWATVSTRSSSWLCSSLSASSLTALVTFTASCSGGSPSRRI